MTKKDLTILSKDKLGFKGYDIDFVYKESSHTISIRDCGGYITIWFPYYRDDTPEFLDVYTRALRVTHKLVKKMSKTK